jgi:hypothetical protein
VGHYQNVAIETYRNFDEPSSSAIRARPLPGQGFPGDTKVECSKKMRSAYPVGTVFIVRAQVTNRDDGTLFLYTSWQWEYQVVEKDAALARVAAGSLGNAT